IQACPQRAERQRLRRPARKRRTHAERVDDQIKRGAHTAIGESEAPLMRTHHVAATLDLRPRSARGVIKHLKQRAAMNTQTAGRTLATRGIAYIEHHIPVRLRLSEKPRDWRAERTNGVTGADVIENTQPNRLQNDAGTQRLRRLQLVEHHDVGARAPQQRRAREPRNTAPRDRDIEPPHYGFAPFSLAKISNTSERSANRDVT